MQISEAFRTVVNGREAIDYRSGKGVYADRKRYPVPAVVRLDLGLMIRVLWTPHRADKTEALLPGDAEAASMPCPYARCLLGHGVPIFVVSL